MPLRIEDYALIGDCETAALVGRDGSIDWLCLPRFDSDSCFAALLGDVDNGRWKVAPLEASEITRRYRDDTLILETTFKTSDGTVLLIDFMPPKGKYSDVMRIVIGIDGTVHLRSELAVRFNYGLSVPWVTGPRSGILCAIAGQTCWYLRPRFRNRGDAIGFVDEAIEDRVGERPCQPGSRGTLEIVLDGAACHDGLPPGEGMFLACSFWLADAYEMLGRMKDAGNCMSACSRCATTWSTV